MNERREKPATVVFINQRSANKISSTPYSDLLTQLMNSATPTTGCPCTGQIEKLLGGFNLLFDRFGRLESLVSQTLLKKRTRDSGTAEILTAF